MIIFSFNSYLFRQSAAVSKQRQIHQHDKVLRDHHQRNVQPEQDEDASVHYRLHDNQKEHAARSIEL